MTNKQKLQLRILKTVVLHFSKDPKSLRSVYGHGFNRNCYYFPPPSKRKTGSIGCAIGMFIPWEMENDFKKYNTDSIDDVWEILPQELKDCGEGFLDDLQLFHDNEQYWDNEGLTPKGRIFHNTIKWKIKTGEYSKDYIMV